MITIDHSGQPSANHIPFLLSRDDGSFGVLSGHVARANKAWTHDQENVLAVFGGPNAYISPSWYPTKKEDGRAVPTWNYSVVHARGSMTVHEEPAWLREHLEGLTRLNESGRPEPWNVSDAPEDYVEKLLKAIVGIEIHVADLLGKFKLSQNQPEANIAGVVAGLGTSERDDDRGVARAMEGHRKL